VANAPIYANKQLRADTVDFMLSREHLYRPKLGVHGKLSIADILPVFIEAGLQYCDRLLTRQKAHGDLLIMGGWITSRIEDPENALGNYRLLTSTVDLLENHEWEIRSAADIRGQFSFPELAHKPVIWGGYLLEKQASKS
jgi:hypothetical protein